MARRIQKPIGIYVLTILLVIFAGLFPLLAVLAAITAPEVRYPFTFVFVSLLLPVLSIVAAIWAFLGENQGRIAALIAVSLNFLWWTFVSIINVAYSDNEALNGAFFLLGLVRPAVAFGLFWWYFTKKEIVAYYKQEANT